MAVCALLRLFQHHFLITWMYLSLYWFFSQPSSTSPSPIPHFFPLLVSDCVHCSTRLCLALRSTVKSHKWCITHSTQHCPRNRLDLCMTACPDPQYPPPGTVLIYNASHTDQGSCVNVKTRSFFFSVIYGRKTLSSVCEQSLSGFGTHSVCTWVQKVRICLLWLLLAS